MKKILTIVCLAGMLTGWAQAQTKLRIGNLEFSVRQNPEGTDTIVQIEVNDGTQTIVTRRKSDDEHKPRRRYHTSTWYFGTEFMLPESGNDYLNTYNGNSYQFNTGYRYAFHPTRWYAIGATAQYTFYNYRLRDASEAMTGVASDPYKEMYRSNNLGAGVFNRIYIVPGKRSRPNSDGLYVDFGIQGEWAYGRFYKAKTDDGDYSVKSKYRNGYAFMPFTANAFAGVGYSWFAVYAHYRFTDALNRDAINFKLPPITVGVQFAVDW